MVLTHWGRVTHMCVANPTVIGSDNGLSPSRRQAIIWSNAGILSIGPKRPHVSQWNFNRNAYIFIKKMHFKRPLAKSRPFCLGLNVLILPVLKLTGELGQNPVPRFNIKMPSYQYRKSHCGDKTVVRLSSYLHNGISYTGKILSLYWIGALAVDNPVSFITGHQQPSHWIYEITSPQSSVRKYFNFLRHLNIGRMLTVERSQMLLPRWRHQMEIFSLLLASCAENSPVPGEFPAQRPVMRSFDDFFALRVNKRLSKQSWGW